MSNQNVLVVSYPPRYGIVTSELGSKKSFEGTLFPDVFSGCYKSVESIIRRNLDCNQAETTVFEPFVNPIIAITGSRGSGKSSAMVSFAEYLKKNTIAQSTFTVLPIIDATQFGKNESVIGNITASMYREYCYISDKLSVDRKREFVRLVKEVNNTAVMYSTGEWFKCGDDLLQDSEKVGNLRKRLHDLIRVYLSIRFESNSNNNYLVIMLDDLDMCSEGAFSIVEEIRKFLCMRNVVILMTMKSDQLRTVLQASYSKAFKGADDGIKSDLQNISCGLAFRSYEKLFPAARCHAMPTFNAEQLKKIDLSIAHKVDGKDVDVYGEYLENPTDLLFGKLKKGDRSKILYRTLHLIWRKTLMIPMCNKDGEHLLIPNTLRSLHNFIAMLSGLDDAFEVSKIDGSKFPVFIPGVEGFESFTDEKNKYISKEVLKKNLTIFENYLMDNLSSYGDFSVNNDNNNKLIKTLLNLIREMDSVSLEHLNAKIVGDILDSLSGDYSKSLYGEENDLDSLREAAFYANSISVGDVMYVLGKISDRTRCRYVAYLVEVVRTLWSIRMTREFYMSCNYNSKELYVSKTFRSAVGGLIVNANAVSFTERDEGDWYKYEKKELNKSFLGKNCYVSSLKLPSSGKLEDVKSRDEYKDYRVPHSKGKPYYTEKKHDLTKYFYACHPLAYYTNELTVENSNILYLPFFSLDFLSCFYDTFKEKFYEKNAEFKTTTPVAVFRTFDNLKTDAIGEMLDKVKSYIPLPHNTKIYSTIKKIYNQEIQSIDLEDNYPGIQKINEISKKCDFLKGCEEALIQYGDRSILDNFIEILENIKTLEDELKKTNSKRKNTSKKGSGEQNEVRSKSEIIKSRNDEYTKLRESAFYTRIQDERKGSQS